MILVSFSFSFFSPLFFTLVEEGKKSCLCYFQKEGGVSQERRRLSSSSYVTFTLPTLVNTLMQRGNLWNLCMKNEDCKKKSQLSKEINHCMFIMQVSMNKESLRKQVDQHRRTFVIITSIVTELWTHSYIWSQCHPPTVGTIANVTVVLGFPLSFGHLWSLV